MKMQKQQCVDKKSYYVSFVFLYNTVRRKNILFTVQKPKNMIIWYERKRKEGKHYAFS